MVASWLDGLAWLRQCFPRLIVFVLVVLAGFAFQSERRQNPRWTSPYYSAAANFQPGRGFYFDVEDAKQHCRLQHYGKEREYRFRRSENLTRHDRKAFGYVYVILLATTLFGWLLGDIQSLLTMQILAHAATTVVAMGYLKSQAARTTLVVIYGINPLIIHFVTLNYYYFWQMIPSLALVALHFKRSRHSTLAWTVWAMALAMIVSVRPTTIGAVGLVFIGLYKQVSWSRALLPLVVCVTTFHLIDFGHDQNPWHSAYIGVGAYSNPYMGSLDDGHGYRLMELKTGVKLNIEIGGNYYIDSIRDRYREVTRSEYFRILGESPLLLAKNALVNVLSSFSVGYASGMPDPVNYAIAFSGILILGLLLVLREYWMVLAIGSTSITFAPYYPPVQAYMFGSFLLLSFIAAKFVFDDRHLSRAWTRLNRRRENERLAEETNSLLQTPTQGM